MKTRMKQMAIVLLALLFFAACNNAKKDKDVIKIGAVLPLTGDFSAIGGWMKSGVLFAEKEIDTTENGFKLDVIIDDGKSNVSSSITALQKMLSVNKPKFIITTTSPVCLAFKEKLLNEKVIFFANAAHPDLTKENTQLFFRHSNTTEQEGKLISDFVLNRTDSKEKSIVVLYLNNDFGISFRNVIDGNLKKYIRTYESFDASQKDFKNTIIKNINKETQQIMILGFTQNIGILIKTIREYGFNGDIICNLGFTTPSVIKDAGAASKGVYYVDYAFDEKSEIINSYKKFCDENNYQYSPIGLLGYNTIMIIFEAIKKTNNGSINDISNFIKENKSFKIHDFTLTINEKGDILPPLEIKKYE